MRWYAHRAAAPQSNLLWGSLTEVVQEFFRSLGVRVPNYRLLSRTDAEWRDLKHAVYATAALYERSGEDAVAQRLQSTGLKSLQRARAHNTHMRACAHVRTTH